MVIGIAMIINCIREICLWNKIKAKLGDGFGWYMIFVDKHVLFKILNTGIDFDSPSHRIFSEKEMSDEIDKGND